MRRPTVGHARAVRASVGDLERVARVKLSEGAEFSESTVVDTASFVRINFATDAATDAATLTEILRRVGAVLLRGADPRRG